MAHLRSKPRFGKYSGLTIVLSNPSRFDKANGLQPGKGMDNLLSAGGGHVMNDCLKPYYNTLMCDVRVADDKSPLLEGTKCILLLGEYAYADWMPNSGNALNEIRGSVLQCRGLPCIASYTPQDCADARAYERTLNTESKEYAPDEAGDSDEADGDEKRITQTKRSNFYFWLKADCKKVLHILREGVVPMEPQPCYINYPNSDTVIEVLSDHKGKDFYLDLETDYEEQNHQCFSFTFNGSEVFNVPWLDYNYKPAYGNMHRIYRALRRACWYNRVVAHNGACFDFLVLAFKYNIAVQNVYDTMVAQHRCFPDVEKSLGHFTSLWTWQPFHKDEDSRGYMTQKQMEQRMAYCGKDVFTMFLGKQKLEAYASTIPGLTHSIQTAQDSIIPYLTTTIQGISYSPEEVAAKRKENDRWMAQYLRMIRMLIGENGMQDVQSYLKKSSKSALPSSNPQCCAYFYNMLGYPVAAYGKPDQFGKRHPSLAKKAMFKLALKHDNPVITLCNLFRLTRLETTTPLGFIPWKDNDGKIVKKDGYEFQDDL